MMKEAFGLDESLFYLTFVELVINLTKKYLLFICFVLECKGIN